jgi:2,3-bisphosphoglycerate-independent phosphoglycerate mutase
VVAAVNLLKGIGCSAGLSCPDIPGATGTLHTNYAGKAAGAIEAFKSGKDFVFIHVEAPDECSHIGDLDGKLKSLEFIDEKIFKPVTDYLENSGRPYRVLVLPDHMTPIETRTHSSEPVPFILFDSQNRLPADESKLFSEACGARGRSFESGGALADYFFRK